MSDIETVKVKSGDDFAIINKSDYDPDVHELHDDESKAKIAADDAEKNEAVKADEARRVADANRGVPVTKAADTDNRNPSGTYGEPTPTDVRYPNKDATEFENNHGAFVGKSAAEMRETKGMEDKPGGLIPEVHEKVQAAARATAEAADVAANTDADTTDGLHVGKGPAGRFYVKDGKDRVSEGFATEAEANDALAAAKANREPSDQTDTAGRTEPTSA